MRLLDLYCGAGGAAMGYHQAGFTVIGVDLAPQPNYPFEFHQADALTFDTDGYDAIHASPPCQAHSKLRRGRWSEREHPALITATRDRLAASGVPYVIENVEGAPLHDPVTLCGSMIGLRVRRHRLFESNIPLRPPGPCRHAAQGRVVQVNGHPGGSSRRDGDKRHSTDEWRAAMGINWMTGRELAEAIPPAYTEFIGRQLVEAAR